MNLPYDYSRCVGQTDWATKQPGQPEKLHQLCNDCRRREPGHPERQVYITPAIDKRGVCCNRIGQAA